MFGFGSARKKGTAMALEGLRPYVGMVQGLYGIPPGYWRDPYILGFFNTLIGLFGKIATDGKLTGAELGFVLQDSLTALSNMNGAAISREATQLALAKDPEYMRGVDDGLSIFLYTFQMHRNEAGDPLVVEATKVAKAMAEPGDFRAQVGAFMTHLSYMKHVRENLLHNS